MNIMLQSLGGGGGGASTTRTREDFDGSDGSGSTGDTNRVFTVTSGSSITIVEVYLSGVLLIETTNYTVNNGAKTVTLVSTAVLDGHNLSVFYNV